MFEISQEQTSAQWCTFEGIIYNKQGKTVTDTHLSLFIREENDPFVML